MKGSSFKPSMIMCSDTLIYNGKIYSSHNHFQESANLFNKLEKVGFPENPRNHQYIKWCYPNLSSRMANSYIQHTVEDLNISSRSFLHPSRYCSGYVRFKFTRTFRMFFIHCKFEVETSAEYKVHPVLLISFLIFL